MNWATTDLDQLRAQIWQALEAAAASLENPLRTAALATAIDLELAARTVVLRRVDAGARSLACYSDVRAAKVRHLRTNPTVQWLFHDPLSRMQIRASGVATTHHENALALAVWEQLPAVNRLNYATRLAPGNRIGSPDEALPVELRGRELTAVDLEFARQNFAVITTCIDHLEWLLLAPAGHRRAGFTWVDGRFTGHWLVP